MIEHKDVEPFHRPQNLVEETLRNCQPNDSECTINKFPMEDNCRNLRNSSLTYCINILINKMALYSFEKAVVTHPIQLLLFEDKFLNIYKYTYLTEIPSFKVIYV